MGKKTAEEVSLADLCKRIEDGFAAGQSGMDEPQLDLIMQLANRTDVIQSLVRQFAATDDYLVDIRAEHLDGSEPALGELLEVNDKLWEKVRHASR